MAKFRTYCGVWYPTEDPSHMFAIERLKAEKYPFIACDHDRDRYTSAETDDPNKIGQLKKIHTHIVIQFNNPRSYDAVVKELNISSNYLQICRDTKGSVLYLIHDQDADKYQYEVADCYGPLVPLLEKYLSDETESVRALSLLRLLDSMPKPVTYRQFLEKACEAELYGDFRRMGFGVTKLIEEHNGVGFNF